MQMPHSSIVWVVLLLLGFNSGYSQSVNFEDGFEDGDHTANPVWTGKTEDFKVVNNDGTLNHLLQLDSEVSNSLTYLSTSSSEIEGEWVLYIKFEGFEPSGSNQVARFLMSDIADLNGSVNGYAVQVGESGDDYFKIVRYDNGTEVSTVLTGTTVVQSGNSYTVRVDRDGTGNWEMAVSNSYGGPFGTTISGTDNTHTRSSYFGTKVKFTASRSDKFFFDFKIDLPPFDVTDASISNNNNSQVDITFNRDYKQSTVQTSDCSINKGIGLRSTLSSINQNAMRLRYGSPTINTIQYTLTVIDIGDQSVAAMAATSVVKFSVFVTYGPGDVISHAFMYADPPGQSEYIEIKNRSDKLPVLQDWQIG